MKLSTESLALACARHPWRTIGAWVVLVVVSFVVIATLFGDLTTEGEVTSATDSKRVDELQFERFRPTEEDFQQQVSDVVVISLEEGTMDDPAVEERVQALADELGELGATHVVTYADQEELVSEDREATAVLIGLGPNEDAIGDVVDAVDRLDAEPGFDAAITGETVLDEDFSALSEEDLQEGELFFGAPAALIVLLLVFGAVVAGVIPLVLALLSILVAIALTAIVGQAFELSVFVTNMIFGMGLALGIDYSLFILSRFREERRSEREKVDAIVTAGATASRAVLFSGAAFVLAMTGLLLVPNTIMRSLATGAILVGIVSVIAALTLLPAVLSLLGDRIDSLRIPYFGRASAQAGEPVLGDDRARGHAAPRREPRRGRRPPARRGDSLPLARDRDGRHQHAPRALRVAAGLRAPQPRVPRADHRSGPHRRRRRRGVGRRPGRGGASDRSARRARGLRRAAGGDEPRQRPRSVTVPVAGDSVSSEAVAAVRDLRDNVIPAAFAGTGAEAFVGGDTAEDIDYYDVMNAWLPIVITFVLGLSFILLTIAFRSIVVPATAIAMNLLAVGAAYGLLVLVFVKGVGNEIFGFQQVDIIEAWVPLFLFAVLFGLSMDYQVFLLSRIRERYSQTGDNEDAVAFGVGSTARLITGAALIIIAVFAGFARGDLVMFQQMGFGVAVALFIDATIIRSVVVPATMTLLGRWNWYLPSWLSWLPDVHVEGHEEEPSSPPSNTVLLGLALVRVVAAVVRDERAEQAGEGDAGADLEEQP